MTDIEESYADFQNRQITERLDRIEVNIGALGASVNSVVDTVNGFLNMAQGMLANGGLGKLMGSLQGRSDG